MDSRKCEALVTVVEAGNIRGSAERLGYTPSGVSRMISSLEQELGVRLLVRDRTGVAPTQECQALLPLLRKVASAARSCTAAAQELTSLGAGRVRVGIAYPQLYGALIGALATFRRLHPHISFDLREGNSTPLAALLEEGGLDLAIISRREGAFAWHPLLEDRLVAVLPASHPLAGAASYPLTRFADEPYVEIAAGEQTDNARTFTQLGITPNTRFTVSASTAAYQIVAAGLGVTLTNEILARPHLKAGELVMLPTEPAVKVSLGVASQEAGLAGNAARAFLAHVLPRLEDAIRT